MLLDKDLEIINKIYRSQPDRHEPPTVEDLKSFIAVINKIVNDYLHESRFDVEIPVFDKKFNVKYGLRMAHYTLPKSALSKDALDRIMKLAGVQTAELEQGKPAFAIQEHVLADTLSELRFDESIENHGLLNKLLEDHFSSLGFRDSNIHGLIETQVDVKSYFSEDQKAALVRMYVVTDIALGVANKLLDEIYDEQAEKSRKEFVEYKGKKLLAEQKAIAANYIKHRQDCTVEPLSLGELSEHMTDDEKNDKWVQISDAETLTVNDVPLVKGTYDTRKDQHLLSEIEDYLYKIRNLSGGPHFADKIAIVKRLKSRLNIPKNSYHLTAWETDEVERLQRIKQFLRLVHLVAHKAAYIFNDISEVPLCHLHADGSFTDDEYMKEIINVTLMTGELLPEDIHHIHTCYADKSIVIGLKMVAKSEDEKPIIKLKVDDTDEHGRLPPVVPNWRVKIDDEGYKPYLSDFA